MDNSLDPDKVLAYQTHRTPTCDHLARGSNCPDPTHQCPIVLSARLFHETTVRIDSHGFALIPVKSVRFLWGAFRARAHGVAWTRRCSGVRWGRPGRSSPSPGSLSTNVRGSSPCRAAKLSISWFRADLLARYSLVGKATTKIWRGGRPGVRAERALRGTRAAAYREAAGPAV